MKLKGTSGKRVVDDKAVTFFLKGKIGFVGYNVTCSSVSI